MMAVALTINARKGLSAKQLQRDLSVNYRTAWYLEHRIRKAMGLGNFTDEKMTGTVEIDETYIGGKFDKRRKRARWDKEPVFGMIERGGRVRAHVVPSTRRPALMKHVTRSVAEGSTVYTDQAKVYRGLPAAGFEHHRIDHSAKVYVSGDVHTQTIEGFWSLVKRGISGTHHAVSPKWLQGYLNEYVWRYNHRDDGRAMFLSLILRAALG
jgi:transposase-like protein